jgi:phosphofructokinase-like protein
VASEVRDKKRIGVLTSGGDCAGLNAVIRAIVHRGVTAYGWDIVGILRGTRGLMADPPESINLTLDMFQGEALRTGGTMIGTTSSGDPFAFPMPDGSIKDRSEEAIAGYKKLGLDALIAIGGDGSLRILGKLATQGGIDMVGIPKTIDNDVAGTENAIGYITAVNVATEALDRLHTTAASHSRIMILEVMGRDAGHIALSAGIAGGADIILIPEISYSLASIVQKINDIEKTYGRNFALMVVAEGCLTETGEAVTIHNDLEKTRYGGIGHYLADQLASVTGRETRFNMLGHVQRGGTPATTDRVLGSAFGVRAVDLVHEGRFGRMVAWQNRKVVDIDLADVMFVTRKVDLEGDLVRTARGLDISFGDR